MTKSDIIKSRKEQDEKFRQFKLSVEHKAKLKGYRSLKHFITDGWGIPESTGRYRLASPDNLTCRQASHLARLLDLTPEEKGAIL